MRRCGAVKKGGRKGGWSIDRMLVIRELEIIFIAIPPDERYVESRAA